MNGRSPRRPAVVVTALLLSLTACGTRVSQQEVAVGAGGGTVSLDPASIAALRAATGGSAAPLTGATTAGGGGTQTGAPARAPQSSLPGPTPVASAAAAAAPAKGPTGAAKATEKKARPTTAAAAPTPAAGAPGPAAGASSTVADAPCTTPGAPLKLGQIGSFSGVAGPITAGARTALAAWAQAVNARGGLACHPVVLYSVDDGSDPAKAASLIQDLVTNKGVQALVGVFDALAFQGIVSGVEKAKLPVVGGDGIDFAWNTDPYLFPVGAGNLGVIRGAIRQTVASGKLNAGLLYCVEASVCTSIAKILPDEVAKAGAKLTYSSAISLTQTDFTAQCQNAKNAGVQALGMAMDGASIGRVARSCASINYHPQFVTNGLVLSAANGADPDVRADSLSSASAVAPWMLDDNAGQREYHAAMARYAPNALADGPSITAWASGKLLEAAIAGLGAKARATPITTADILAGLGTIHQQTLGGLTPPITFSLGQKSAPLIECVFFELLTDKGWTARDSKPVCK
jgi:branched-chain amino acid transport system substrate-binding protein